MFNIQACLVCKALPLMCVYCSSGLSPWSCASSTFLRGKMCWLWYGLLWLLFLLSADPLQYVKLLQKQVGQSCQKKPRFGLFVSWSDADWLWATLELMAMAVDTNKNTRDVMRQKDVCCLESTSHLYSWRLYTSSLLFPSASGHWQPCYCVRSFMYIPVWQRDRTVNVK